MGRHKSPCSGVSSNLIAGNYTRATGGGVMTNTNFLSPRAPSLHSLLVFALLLLILGSGSLQKTVPAVARAATGSSLKREGGGLWAPDRVRNATMDSTEATPPSQWPKPTPTTLNTANIRHHRSRKVFMRRMEAGRRVTEWDKTGGYQADGDRAAHGRVELANGRIRTKDSLKVIKEARLQNTSQNRTAPSEQRSTQEKSGNGRLVNSSNSATSFANNSLEESRNVPQENQLAERLNDETLATNSGDGGESVSTDGQMQAENKSDGDEEDYEIIYSTKNQIGNYDYAAPQSTESPPHQTTQDLDIVSKFLRFIEANNEHNCTAGTDLKLGQGIVDRYAQERFRLEAELAVNRANMLTRLWKYSPHSMDSEYLLHAAVISLVEFDDDIFAGGNCYDRNEYGNYSLFCPFAYRLPEGNILVKDLAVEYKYLSDSSEFFYAARKKAERVIRSYNQFSRAYHQYPLNDTHHFPGRTVDEILNVTYEDGKWSEPYFDCGGGNIWMMTYTVPFFGFRDGTYFFKGTSGIDIDLRRVDIDQCYANPGELNLFANSNKCKNATTQCVPIKGLGFRRGSYKCECRRGFYFPNVTSPLKYFNGSQLEEEYENKFHSKSSRYDDPLAFHCLPCPVDCEQCEDDRPCVVTLNWVMRTAILILQSGIIAMLPIVGIFTWRYSEVKVVRAASPVLLRFIVLGAFFIYCTTLVMYPTPSLFTCTARVWLREVGFSLAYGALMLKTWRISVIFRVRSAKAVKITDLDLMKRLGVIVAVFTALLTIRTLVSPPHSVVSYTAQDLKAWLCESDWWDHSFTIMELSLLVWGIRLCIVVRKAPSEFNESKFISLAIYNEFLLSLFLNISMLFLQSPANPDLLYIIFFCHVQLTMTLLLCLIFGSKAYIVFRGGDKQQDEARAANPKFISKSRSSGQSTHKHGHPTSGYYSIGGDKHGSMMNSNSHGLSNTSLVSEEFHRIYTQLEDLKKHNLKLGEIALVGKIIAMQESANKIIIQTTATKKEPEQQQLKAQLQQTLLQVSSSNPPPGSTSNNLYTNATVLPGSGAGASRKKSVPMLSNIFEEKSSNPGSPSPHVTSIAQDTVQSEGCSKSAVPEVQTTAVVEVEALVSCNPEQEIISPTSPSENEVHIGDDLYMDAVEEEDDEPRAKLALAPCASSEHEGDAEEPPSRRSANSGSKNKRCLKQDTIEFIDEDGDGGDDVVETTPPQDGEVKPVTAVHPVETVIADEKKKESPIVMLDLDDKSRFTEEVTV